jgi:hypothetical protein
VVDLRAVGQRFGQVTLQSLQFGLQGACPAVELAVAQEVGEVFTEVNISVSEEIALAAPPGSL